MVTPAGVAMRPAHVPPTSSLCPALRVLRPLASNARRWSLRFPFTRLPFLGLAGDGPSNFQTAELLL